MEWIPCNMARESCWRFSQLPSFVAVMKSSTYASMSVVDDRELAGVALRSISLSISASYGCGGSGWSPSNSMMSRGFRTTAEEGRTLGPPHL